MPQCSSATTFVSEMQKIAKNYLFNFVVVQEMDVDGSGTVSFQEMCQQFKKMVQVPVRLVTTIATPAGSVAWLCFMIMTVI